MAEIVGRDTELDELTSALRGSGRRVVTIVGAGGAGKTTLALELAQRLAGEYRHGATFVSLVGLDDSRLLGSEVGRALGLADAPGGHPIDRLVWGLRGQHMLLVLDNFEHLIDAAGVVGELSARCPDVTVLVTSRRRLNLPGEHVVRLGGLAVSGPHTVAGATDAVELFRRRALAVDPELRIEGDRVQLVAEMCRLLDGLPLAIEVVASHTRTMSIEELADRVRGDDQLIGLDEAIAWSYQLLDPLATRLLPRLAVFSDGWSIDAMHAVCADDDTMFAEWLEALVSLIDLHLVEPMPELNGELRFGLLETVRRFAAHELEQSGDADRVRAAHADFYSAMAVRLGAALESAAQPGVAIEISGEMANLRSAMTWLADQHRWHDGVTMTGSLGLFWLDRGSTHEARDWLRTFLQHATPGSPEHAIADAWEARFSTHDPLTMPDDWGDGHGVGAVALTDRLRADRDTLLAAGDLHGAIRVAEHLVQLLGVRDLVEQVDDVVNPLIEAASTPEELWVEADLLRAWTTVLRDSGRLDEALAVNDQAIAIATAVRNQPALARAMLTVGFYVRSSPGEARVEVDPVYDLLIDSGDLRGAAIASITSAMLALIDRDLPAAAGWYRKTIELSRRIGSGDSLMRAVSGALTVAHYSGRNVDAARIYGGLHVFDEQFRYRLPPDILAGYHVIVDRIAGKLGDRFDVEREAGRQAGWDATVDLAITVAEEIMAGGSPAPAAPVRRRGPRANRQLTDRELDVLAQLVAGRTNQQIGDQLAISPKTVMHHTMSVYRKLAVRGRAEAVAHAIRTGLVDA